MMVNLSNSPPFGTPVAPFTGLTTVTSSGLVSGTAEVPVVKLLFDPLIPSNFLKRMVRPG